MNFTNWNVLERSLDASALRQRMTSNNLANADTPYYKAKHVQFEQILKESLQQGQSSFVGQRTYARHLQIGNIGAALPEARVLTEASIVSNDANGVDRDFEMSELARNSIWYNTLSEQMSHELNLLKLAIRGR
jgi:flagellar basal-body rod protein FlgB